MKTNTILFIVAGSILAVSHYFSIEFYLYWRYLWLDIPMHFLGGVAAGLGLFVLRDLRLVGTKGFLSDRWLKLDAVFLYLLSVTVIWEVFEILAGTPKSSNYALDTVLDIAMGLTGGLFAYWLAKNVIKNELN